MSYGFAIVTHLCFLSVSLCAEGALAHGSRFPLPAPLARHG